MTCVATDRVRVGGLFLVLNLMLPLGGIEGQVRTPSDEVRITQASPLASLSAPPRTGPAEVGVPDLSVPLELLTQQLCGGALPLALLDCGGSSPTSNLGTPPSIPPAGNHASITQIGDGNVAHIVQDGDRNAAVAYQKGHGNTTLVHQDGFENVFAAWLVGHDNFVDVIQRGDNNTYILDFVGNNFNPDHHQVLQDGSALNAIQTGTGSFLFGIEQRGQSMNLTIEHHGGGR